MVRSSSSFCFRLLNFALDLWTSVWISTPLKKKIASVNHFFGKRFDFSNSNSNFNPFFLSAIGVLRPHNNPPVGSASRYPNAMGEHKPLSKQIVLSPRIVRVQSVINRVRLLEKSLFPKKEDTPFFLSRCWASLQQKKLKRKTKNNWTFSA